MGGWSRSIRACALFAAAAAMTVTAFCSRDRDPFGPEPADGGRMRFLPGDTLTLPLRWTASVPDGRIAVRFGSVLEDSRCPEDVMCFWEGNARLSFLLTVPDGSHPFALNTHFGFTRDTVISDVRIALIDVLPRRKSGRSIPPNDYRAVLTIR